MISPQPRWLGASTWRRTLYTVVSFTVIASFLLRPMMAIAVIEQQDALVRTATANAVRLPEQSAGKPNRLAHTTALPDKLRTVNVLPSSTMRTAALANPLPSGAKPAYPLNHILDANPQFVGTPPTNYDFETAGYSVGAPPTNHELTAAPYAVGTPPANHTFETGDFTGWTTAGTVTIQSDATHGYYAQLQSSGVLTSDPFTVDSAAQQIAFDLGAPSGTHYAKVYVLHGANYTDSTEIQRADCFGCGWTLYVGTLSAYVGQSIKLKIVRGPGSTIRIDNVHTRTLLPGYTLQGTVERIEEAGGNVYARLAGTTGAVTTAPFPVDSNTQVATVDLIGLTANNDQYKIEVLSDPAFATVTQVAVNTNAPDTWQNVQLNLTAWQGQMIKLRITCLYRTVGVDNIGLQSVFLPGWQMTGTAAVVDEGNGNHYVTTADNLITAAFTLATDVQQLTLRHRSAGAGVNRFELKLLRGANFTEEIDLTGGQEVSNPTTWQTFKVGVNLYAGETVKLKVIAIGPMDFDDGGMGEHLLPGWQLTTNKAIAAGEDGYGSYVTAANGGASTLRSSEIDTGILDRSNHTDFHYYAVAYAIGQSTGSLLRVSWVDAQGQSLQLMQDAADSPTGYRVRYFRIADSMTPVGRLLINVTGGGKVYSVADNIARQHLNEPFSYKVGLQIDTASGSFGYQAQDLRTEGVVPLVFTRYYNGHSDRLGPMGYGWSHSYETRLVITDDDDAGVVFGSGKEIFFTRNGQTFTPADARVYDELVQNGDGSYTFTTKANQQYHFTTAGVLTSIKDPNNNATTLLYDGNGRLVTVVAQGGATFTLAYDANGRLATVTDPLGAVVTYSYDANGDLVSATRPDSGTEQYSYNKHRLSQVVDATGHLLFQNTFDNWHRVIQQTDALGQPLTVQYSTPSAGVTAVTDPNGGISYYYFDRYQRTTHRIDPLGQVTAYLYDSLGNLQAVIGNDDQWNFAYDANGNLLSSTDPLGNPMLFTYNPQQHPTSVVDGNGNTTNFVYDAVGNVTQIIDALGGITSFTYNASGYMLTKTDPLNQTEIYTYDAAGNRLTRTDPLGHTWSYTYDAANRLKSETDPNGHTIQYFYDLAGRMIAIRNHLGGQKNFLYDAVGHLLMAEDEAGRRTLWAYDDRGLVESKTDAANKVTTYGYDNNRNMVSLTDPLNRTTTYAYDANNRLTSQTKSNGSTWHYEYDGNGKLAREINPAGNDVRYFYDDAGRLIHTQFSTEISYLFNYDGNGNLIQKTDPYGWATDYSYDALNRLSAVSDALGTVVSYSYDAASRRLTAGNAANETTTFTYDAANRLIAVTDPLGRSATLGYDAAGNRISTTDPLGRSNGVVYDALNRPVAFVDPAGNQTQLAYDAVGQLTQLTTPTGAVTTFSYDARGLQTSASNPLNQTATVVYDDGSQLIQQIDAANQATSYTYNSAGWLTAITDPLGKTTSYSYDMVGNVTAITDPLGRTQSIAYNAFNQPTTVTDAAGTAIWFDYDWLGRLTTRGALSGSMSFEYDDRGLLVGVTDALGREVTYAYDSVGRRTKMIDPRNNQTLFAYDAAGRLTTMTDTLGGVVSYNYDAADQLTSMTNPNGKTTTYSYDLLGNLLSKTDPLNRSYSFGYDQSGRRTSATDARGITVNYAYDLLNRLATLTHPNGTDSYSYDLLGRLATVTDPTGNTSFSYDAASRVTSVAAPQGTITYSYNDAGQRTSMTLPGSRTVNYGYDSAGRLNAITDWMGSATTLSYNAEGLVNQISRPNGVTAGYSYGLDGTLTNLTYNPNSMFFADYTFDGNNNRTSATTSSGTESYTLDALNRLTNVSYPNGDTAAYSYDANGNRLTQTFNGVITNYSYDDAGQLLSDGATTYSYDANGNLTSAGADSYTWDWANRLTSATVNGQTVNYSYDALNVRVGATVNGAQNTYLWDRLAELPLLVDDGAHAYLHGAGPLAQLDPAGNRQELLTDGLGSVRGVTDGSWNLVGSADYSVFGAYRNQTGATSRFGFTGEYYAQETGLWHLRARDLNSTTGRFLSADPVQPNAPGSQGYNPYAYVANNPTPWVDPSGFSLLPTDLTPAQTAIWWRSWSRCPPRLRYRAGLGWPLFSWRSLSAAPSPTAVATCWAT